MSQLFRIVFFTLILFIVAFSSFEIQATPNDDCLFLKNALFFEQAIHVNNYPKLGKLLRCTLKTRRTAALVKQLAQSLRAETLIQAIDTAELLFAKAKEFDLSLGELAEISLYIEAVIPKHVQSGTYYFPKDKTHLAATIEVDRETNDKYIVLDGVEEAFLGEGKYKTVYKAIRYSKIEPQIVARAQQVTDEEKELNITKRLKGRPGIFETYTLTQHNTKGKKFVSIYSKLYRPGSLRAAFVAKMRFSFYEKVKIALNLLSGLDELHKRDIIHRDLSTRNYLVDIPEGKMGRRDVVAVIADLGRADYIWTKFEKKTRIQGHTAYTSPEALFKSKIKGKKYFPCEVYALGLVLYQLYFEEEAPWQDSSYVSDESKSLRGRYKELVGKIRFYTDRKRKRIEKKFAQGAISAREEFEYLILKMVDVDPNKRSTALELRDSVLRILNRL